MEKAVQAMVQKKAEALGNDMKKNVGGVFAGNEKEGGEEKGRMTVLLDMEEQQNRKRVEREKLHKKRSDEREKMRTSIRDKYKIKKTASNSSSYIPPPEETHLPPENAISQQPVARSSSPVLDSKKIFCCMS